MARHFQDNLISNELERIRDAGTRSRYHHAWITDMSRPHQLAGERFYLSVRTSMLSEYRNSAGLLRAFEVGCEHTSFGLLCTALERIPGVRFPDRQSPSWFSAPARFTYKGHEYQVCMPFADFWVGPATPDEAWPETEDLLAHVKRNLLGKLLHRVRARYVQT